MNGIVEGDIDTRLPYRIGHPRLPVLPVETKINYVTTYVNLPRLGGPFMVIHDALGAHSIPLIVLHLADRKHDGIDNAEAGRPMTVVLQSTYQQDHQAQWVQAVKDISIGFNKLGIDWAIELIDHRAYMQSLPTSPILSTDRDIIEGWKKALDHHDRDWVAIDAFYRELPSRGMRPTVIVSARDANDNFWWNSVLPALKQISRIYHVELDVVLLYLRGIRFTMPDSTVLKDRIANNSTDPENRLVAHHTIREDFYSDPIIHMGTSCAMVKSASSGTLGSGIKLQKEDIVFSLGLTNYHVLRNALPDQEPLTEPFPPKQDSLYGIAVSPSDMDQKDVLQELERQFMKSTVRHQETQDKLRYLTKNDPAWEKTTRSMKTASDNQASLAAQRHSLSNFSRRIGQVYASSGFRTHDNQNSSEIGTSWALDWCLIQLEQSKSISRRICDVPSSAQHTRHGDEVSQYCKISSNVNYDVMKRGRTSGWTRGTVSGIDSIIRLQDHYLPVPRLPTNVEAKFEGKWGGKPVTVHGIIGTTKTPQFLEPGDSGSLILLDQASNIPGVSIVGLGFAANDTTNASYMIPMDLIMEDIEEVTGAMVVEPHFMGMVLVERG